MYILLSITLTTIVISVPLTLFSFLVPTLTRSEGRIYHQTKKNDKNFVTSN